MYVSDLVMWGGGRFALKRCQNTRLNYKEVLNSGRGAVAVCLPLPLYTGLLGQSQMSRVSENTKKFDIEDAIDGCIMKYFHISSISTPLFGRNPVKDDSFTRRKTLHDFTLTNKRKRGQTMF